MIIIHDPVIVGVIGTLAGATIGGIIGYFGSTNATKKLINFEQEKHEKEERAKELYARHIIISFLKNEIEFNYNILKISKSKDLPIEKRYSLSFDEYNRVKYKLLEHPTTLVKEINHLYSLFYDITLLRNNRTDSARTEKLNEIIKQKGKLDQLMNN